MAQHINRQVLLVKRPTGIPDPSCFSLVESSVPEPSDGQLLLRTLYISIDPYMRGRMNDRKSYAPPFQLNEVLNGGVVAEVVESRSSGFVPGDFVEGNLPWQDWSVASEKRVRKVDPSIAPVSTALGILGMPGLTAYFGLIDIGDPKPGETVVISGAGGAVGTTAGQIARIKGCMVVGIVGSDRKARYLEQELGFVKALNYRMGAGLRPALEAACPDGIDIYFDNVGGEISDATMPLLNRHARVPLCGQISLYNEANVPLGPRLQPLLLSKSAKMQGFLVSDFSPRFDIAIKDLAGWLTAKKLKYVEYVVAGLENIPRVFIGLFEGENLGKLLVKVV